MKPTNFDNLKTPKTGYQWVSRGKGWDNDGNKSASYGACNDGIWMYYENNAPMGWSNTEYAELVPTAPARISLEEQINLGKSMVGKTFLWKNRDQFTIKSWHVSSELSHMKHSGMVVDEIAEFGVSVYVLATDGAQYPVTCEHITEYVKPPYKEVVLNKNYTAKVYEDKIEVGCQSFPIDIIEDLVQAAREISNQ